MIQKIQNLISKNIKKLQDTKKLVNTRIIKDSRAQISAEMIIILAAIMAIALLLVTNLKNSAQSASEKTTKKTEEILKQIDEI